MMGWDRMIAQKCRIILWVAQMQLEEVCILLEEEIHNNALQEDIPQCEMVVCE